GRDAMAAGGRSPAAVDGVVVKVVKVLGGKLVQGIALDAGQDAVGHAVVVDRIISPLELESHASGVDGAAGRSVEVSDGHVVEAGPVAEPCAFTGMPDDVVGVADVAEVLGQDGIGQIDIQDDVSGEMDVGGGSAGGGDSEVSAVLVEVLPVAGLVAVDADAVLDFDVVSLIDGVDADGISQSVGAVKASDAATQDVVVPADEELVSSRPPGEAVLEQDIVGVVADV